MSICISCVCLIPEETKEDTSPEIVVMDGGGPPYGCWEFKLRPLQEQVF